MTEEKHKIRTTQTFDIKLEIIVTDCINIYCLLGVCLSRVYRLQIPSTIGSCSNSSSNKHLLFYHSKFQFSGNTKTHHMFNPHYAIRLRKCVIV